MGRVIRSERSEARRKHEKKTATCPYLWEKVAVVTCGTCGNRSEEVDVHFCRFYADRCTVRKKARSVSRTCLTCENGPYADLFT